MPNALLFATAMESKMCTAKIQAIKAYSSNPSILSVCVFPRTARRSSNRASWIVMSRLSFTIMTFWIIFGPRGVFSFTVDIPRSNRDLTFFVMAFSHHLISGSYCETECHILLFAEIYFGFSDTLYCNLGCGQSLQGWAPKVTGGANLPPAISMVSWYSSSAVRKHWLPSLLLPSSFSSIVVPAS